MRRRGDALNIRDIATTRLAGRQLVFSLRQGQACRFNRDEFERFADMATAFGATHIQVGFFPFRYGTWFLPDNTDPYPSWSNTGMAIFRIFPPKALRKWISLKEARQMQAILEAQMSVARRHGLKGEVEGCEPLWLPEGVYRSHPHWRGPQCELGRIARKPYFAPSIDEPEVLDLYREAMREIANRFPDIDSYSFMANDSGSGISWSPCLYPGYNGPPKWRKRDWGARVAGWIAAMQEGAKAGGASIRINVWASGIPEAFAASARLRLSPGQFVNWSNPLGENWGGPGAALGGGLWSTYHPAVGLGRVCDFARDLQAIYSNPAHDTLRCAIGIEPDCLDTACAVIQCVLDEPGHGIISRDKALLLAAALLAGPDKAAESLVNIWAELSTVDTILSKIQQKGFALLLPWTMVAMRWLVRPLVPRPEALVSSETAHYRRFLFSRDADRENNNLCMILGKPVFRGESAVWMARWALDDAARRLLSIRQRLLDLSQSANKQEHRSYLRRLAARVGACMCMVKTARNVIMYQYALDTSSQPQFGPNMMDYDDNIIYDHRSVMMRKIARAELDNTAELLHILEKEDARAIQHARQKDEESVFMLGQDLTGMVRKKIQIMMDHWQEYEDIWPTTKVWEFEPEPAGNIAPLPNTHNESVTNDSDKTNP